MLNRSSSSHASDLLSENRTMGKMEISHSTYDQNKVHPVVSDKQGLSENQMGSYDSTLPSSESEPAVPFVQTASVQAPMLDANQSINSTYKPIGTNGDDNTSNNNLLTADHKLSTMKKSDPAMHANPDASNQGDEIKIPKENKLKESKTSKKKSIISWAKRFGGKEHTFSVSGKKNKKKGKERGLSSKSGDGHDNGESSIGNMEGENNMHSTESRNIINPKKIHDNKSRTSMTEIETTNINKDHNSSLPPSPINNSGLVKDNVDTIQASHITELVNMGFDPAAAKDALDRYDQDLEKATNYLLDQSYH
ncbi:hypothetical protein BDB01DRAFT_31097 [Pilobolus umbonatus]|nr:hypothetical protein BDB01DRAFT_31097 [Pilobolus umbonatus]